MGKIIFSDDVSINCQPDDLTNQGINDRWKTYNFRFILISGNKNQCLQYCLNALYHDIDGIIKATILWLVVHQAQYSICRTNDNAFVFNRMIDCNTTLYDDIDKNGDLVM